MPALRARSCLFWLILCTLVGPALLAQAGVKTYRDAFVNPPDDCRVMMRWWWFGPAIVRPELQYELDQMKAAGVGGVEIATLYPQALDDPSTGFHNVPYLSDEYVDDLRYAAEYARQIGLRVDVTLGSGWPFGGPHIPATEAAGQLRVELVPVAAGATSVVVPALEAGEQRINSFVVAGDGRDFTEARPVSTMEQGRLLLGSPAPVTSTALFFISSRTGMMVKRPAVGAAGFVLDHYNSAATRTHLQAVGDRLLQAFGTAPPHAVFSDSLEVYASDWTPKLLDEFKKRRGYDLAPYLPALVGSIGPSTDAIRHDWGQTLTELVNENFLEPLHDWAEAHHTLFRSQTYGFPPVNLASNRYADLPEGEGKATMTMWRSFSDTRWASSAGHLFGHNVISSETWTWLHSPAFRATPLDMKAEADLHFLQGINQLVGHGWPYSPPGAQEPGWRMYAAGAFDEHNPWFGVMPELTKYLQRVSYALRLGKPANDVALLLPEDDVLASFKARVQPHGSVTGTLGFDESGSNVTIDESMNKFLDESIIPQVLDAGFNLDFIDAEIIDSIGIPYKVLVLPAMARLRPATYARVFEFARHGGIVIATGQLPSTAPGLLHAQEDATQLAHISEILFHGDIKSAHLVQRVSELGSALSSVLSPDVQLTPQTSTIGFIHRKLDNADLYFVANTSNTSQHVRAHFRSSAAYAEEWDAFSGEVHALPQPQDLDLDLEPYGSRILVFTQDAVQRALPGETSGRSIDISKGWKLSFPAEVTSKLDASESWTQDPKSTYFSGTATYEKTIDIPQASHFVLDFGEGMPVRPPSPLPRFNMRAYLESPVREVARIYVNGTLAGSVWHPPYRLDLGALLHQGANQLRIEVSNTAINEMAGRAQPTYRLLYDRYGTLFMPQDMDHLEPLPSGILSSVSLKEIRQMDERNEQ
jgi:hypothetical protein